MSDFKSKIREVEKLWAKQKTRSEKADRLLAECEEIERKMIGLLEDAEKLDPTAYILFLKSFGKDDHDEKMDSI